MYINKNDLLIPLEVCTLFVGTEEDMDTKNKGKKRICY